MAAIEPQTSPSAIAAPLITATADRQPRATAKSKTIDPKNLVIAAAVVLLAVVGFFVVRGTHSPPPGRNETRPERSTKRAPPKNEASRQSTASVARPRVKPPNPVLEPEPALPPAPPPPPASPPDPWQLTNGRGLPTYRLLMVEDPQADASFPLADAVVVGEQMLLTTASAAVELAKFAERGWRMKAVTSSGDKGIAVNRVRLHAAFQPAEPDDQLYFDLALLTTDAPLGSPAPLASAAELAALERGQPLACFATNHTGEAVDRFQELQPALYSTKVFTTTSLEAGGPRLLHLRGSFCNSAAGSPIFNDEGHLVALYCEPAPTEGAPGESGAARGPLPVHFAKLIDLQLISVGLSGTDSPVWVAPVVTSPSPAPATQESAP